MRQSPAERYERFISSDRWRAIRERVFKKRGRRCQVCKTDENIEVHHATYERFGGRELDEDLVVVCQRHHAMIHHFHTLSGLTLPDATRRFLAQQKLKKVQPARKGGARPVDASHTPDGWRPRHLRGVAPGELTRTDWRTERRTLASITVPKPPSSHPPTTRSTLADAGNVDVSPEGKRSGAERGSPSVSPTTTTERTAP